MHIESIDGFEFSKFALRTCEDFVFHPLKHPHSKEAICFILCQSLLCQYPCLDKKTYAQEVQLHLLIYVSYL